MHKKRTEAAAEVEAEAEGNQQRKKAGNNNYGN